MFIFVRSFIWTLIYSVFFFLFYNQVYRPDNKYPSDILVHINFIDTIDILAHPLWHYCIKIISNVFHIPLQQSTILFTAFLVVVIFIVINKILEYTLKSELPNLTSLSKQYVLLLTSLGLLVASAVYFPFFNENLYLGQGSCGVWHNVTLLMVKPFALLSLFLSVLYIQAKDIKYFLLGFSMTVFSIYAKPSYIIVFLPSLYLFVVFFIYKQENAIIKNLFHIKHIVQKYKYISTYLFTVTLVSIVILMMQFSKIYENNTDQSKIIFDFLGVWSHYSSNVLISLLLLTMFPLSVLLFIRYVKSNFYILSLIMFIVSVSVYALFAESGPRYSHGNFAWSMLIAYHIFFLFSTVEFLKWYHLLSDWKKYILSITFSLHIISGIFYLGYILNGKSFF